MKTYTEFKNELMEGWRTYATTKDGHRTLVKNDRHAAEVRDSYHNPKKDPSYNAPAKKAKPGAVDYEHLARKIEMNAGDHYPDTDGFDAMSRHLKKTHPHINSHEHIDHLDKACKKHLGAKSYGDYIDKTYAEFDKDNPRDN